MPKISKRPCAKLPALRLFIVGLPLAGKSTLGQLLAKELGWPFFDLDEQICRKLEMPSVADIFAVKGEETFRKVEQATLTTFLKKVPPFVLATGGGTPCYGTQMQKIKESGYPLYLKLPWVLMARRLQRNREKRPLIEALEARSAGALESACAARLPYYEAASLHFTTSDIFPHKQAKALKICLSKEIYM